jgi:hypothetical protein
LDSKADWRVVCYPYNKFFNFGEPYAVTDIDWSSAVVYEKYDGSLATLYHYKGEWMVASSGVPDASGSIDNNTTFRQLFDVHTPLLLPSLSLFSLFTFNRGHRCLHVILYVIGNMALNEVPISKGHE